jgi:hypothetical protein
MNTLRNIRIATGIKKIELANDNMAMLQIGDILKEHREALITSLLSDLNTYINYTFRTPPKKDQLENIRLRLTDLKKASIGMARYSLIIADILENETTYVKSEPFYHEINEVIGDELNPSQLILVK